MEAIVALQTCPSSVARLLPGQWEVHTAAFSPRGHLEHLSLSEPATDFWEIGRSIIFYVLVLMLNLDIVPSLKFVRFK